MLESLRTPTGRIVFVVAATVVLIVATLLVDPGMLAIVPAIVAELESRRA